jgi:hypothetical protein
VCVCVREEEKGSEGVCVLERKRRGVRGVMCMREEEKGSERERGKEGE